MARFYRVGKDTVRLLLSALLTLSLSISGFIAGPELVFAQTTNPNLTPEQQQALQSQLNEIEQEILAQQNILNEKQQEGASIQRDIAILDAQIKQAQLKIQAHELAIQKLGKDITVKTTTIAALGNKIDQGKSTLGNILQKTYELDNYSVADAMLSNKNISDFFADFDTYNFIKQSLQSQLTDIQQAKQQDEVTKQQLNDQQNQEIDTKVNIEQEQAKIKTAESQKQQLLSLNKVQQLNYQAVISQKQAEANKIRNQLFALRDTSSIKFGDAVSFAKEAQNKTGVEPAFVLAILQQESNLGQNVGSCYLSNTSGAGIKSSTGAVVSNLMKPDRDVQPFLAITQALGRDPYHTLVSCPLSVGYGGAMGPAQFIPSTWVLNESRISAATGRSVTDPWNAEDAIMASALYLSDLGAAGGGYTAERNAACKYYSGRSCSGSNKFYGDQVMARVQSIQGNIDIIASSQ